MIRADLEVPALWRFGHPLRSAVLSVRLSSAESYIDFVSIPPVQTLPRVYYLIYLSRLRRIDPSVQHSIY